MSKTWGVASIVAAGLILAPVGAAAAQPTQSGNGVLIIGQYEAAGYDAVSYTHLTLPTTPYV